LELVNLSKTSSDLNKIKDNKDLIKGCLKNKRVYQELLYRRYFQSMMHLGMRYTNDHDKLIEWVNNGFLKVFRKIGTVKNPEALPGWIKAVVYRSILDGIRSEKRYLKNVVFDIEKSKSAYQLVNGYDYEVIMNYVNELPDSSQRVFRMFVVDGYSHKDIAKELGISEGTSKWHLNNARTRLKIILKDNKILASG